MENIIMSNELLVNNNEIQSTSNKINSKNKSNRQRTQNENDNFDKILSHKTKKHNTKKCINLKESKTKDESIKIENSYLSNKLYIDKIIMKDTKKDIETDSLDLKKVILLLEQFAKSEDFSNIYPKDVDKDNLKLILMEIKNILKNFISLNTSSLNANSFKISEANINIEQAINDLQIMLSGIKNKKEENASFKDLNILEKLKSIKNTLEISFGLKTIENQQFRSEETKTCLSKSNNEAEEKNKSQIILKNPEEKEVISKIATIKESNISPNYSKDSKNIEFFNTADVKINDFKDINLFETNKAFTKNNVNLTNNIYNQIVENTKITLSEDSSEMFIKLKPDNLGNVSMKIVIERGILIAKFDVESQIVKEAIESNLEDLKNALADKGFEIKELNVSVNKDPNNHNSLFNRRNKFYEKKLIKNKISSFDTSIIAEHNKLYSNDSIVNFLA